MAQDIKVKVRLEDGEFKNNLTQDSQQLDNFGNSVKDAATKINQEVQAQVRAAESIGNYRR